MSGLTPHPLLYSLRSSERGKVVTAAEAVYSGEIRAPMSSLTPTRMNERKIIARRAAIEL